MGNFDRAIEQHIQEAMRRGEFDDLPGKGKPLNLEENSWVPEEFRMSYKILKNAGYIPEELQIKKDIHALKERLQETMEESQQKTLLAKLREKMALYGILMEKRQRDPKR